jgi:26S proteasome non-ATPase regulatory subunit 5
LDSNGVLSKMEELLVSSPHAPFAAELFPGLIKFFGHVAHLRPRQVLSNHPAFFTALLSMADDTDDRAQAGWPIN